MAAPATVTLIVAAEKTSTVRERRACRAGLSRIGTEGGHPLRGVAHPGLELALVLRLAEVHLVPICRLE